VIRLVFGDGTLAKLPEFARALGFSRTLVVADRGIVATGHVARVLDMLDGAGIVAHTFHDFDSNPDDRMVEAGRVVAARHRVDSIVGIGGGSSLDCAKGINFVVTNGGTMRDYWGFAKATKAMLPSIGVPTTAGTGSEAQSYALISDAATHTKMACGDPKARFRVAILDPELTVSQPRVVTALAGYDAISHAVESYVTTKRTPASDALALEAWRLLEANFERVLSDPSDLAARGAMLLGAHKAGAAIELSMLGATHACANPLTAHYGIAHGAAIAVMLPHVVRWNIGHVDGRYAELSGRLPDRLDALARAAGLATTLRALQVREDSLETLSADAAKQWTGTFNPRPFDAMAALHLYRAAF
jgi:alcohol dehydrogenase class IV